MERYIIKPPRRANLCYKGQNACPKAWLLFRGSTVIPRDSAKGSNGCSGALFQGDVRGGADFIALAKEFQKMSPDNFVAEISSFVYSNSDIDQVRCSYDELEMTYLKKISFKDYSGVFDILLQTEKYDVKFFVFMHSQNTAM